MDWNVLWLRTSVHFFVLEMISALIYLFFFPPWLFCWMFCEKDIIGTSKACSFYFLRNEWREGIVGAHSCLLHWTITFFPPELTPRCWWWRCIWNQSKQLLHSEMVCVLSVSFTSNWTGFAPLNVQYHLMTVRLISYFDHLFSKGTERKDRAFWVQVLALALASPSPHSTSGF